VRYKLKRYESFISETTVGMVNLCGI